MSAQRLFVEEHHSTTNPSEVIQVRVDVGEAEPFRIIVEHLGSTKSVVVDFVYPDGERLRQEHLYYPEPEPSDD